MRLPTYKWPSVAQFVERAEELDRLESWWASSELTPVSLYGRRRVGKSWLLRRFAHGKPATILVAERLATGAQLTRFAAAIAPTQGGVAPDLPDVPALFRALFRVARTRRLLAVVDEFPSLLGSTQAEVEQTLSAVQAVMEDERDASRLKLVLCGSAVAQMEAMQSQRSPMHGRLIPLELRPLESSRAAPFLGRHEPVDRFERYAIAGGMPRYLVAIGNGTLREAVCRQILQPDAPLWNEGRTIVGQELREPAIHFAVLEALASGEKEVSEVSNALRLPGSTISKYLSTLESLRLVKRQLPLGASPLARGGHWLLDDPFLRFWFRYVFPYQADLEAGLRPTDLYDTEIAPTLAQHIARVFEDSCRTHASRTYGAVATHIGRWWGNALDSLRRSGERSSEEIDIVGIARGRVTLIGEAKWTNAPMSQNVLRELRLFKLPALQQAGFKPAAAIRTVLYCKSGFHGSLLKAAAGEPDLELVEASQVV